MGCLAESCLATLRVFENVPLVGHIVAAFYSCTLGKDHAERAGIKASLGALLCVCNFPAEAVDEVGRKRSKKIHSYYLTQRPDWMKAYHKRGLRYLCLPGSHQSGTYHMHKKLSPVPMVEGWSRCQALDIEEQLLGGIRFLDLRIMTDETDKELWLHHNLVTCVKVKDVFEVVRDFVAEYPTEIIGIHITNDGKSVDWTKCHLLVNDYFGSRLIMEHMKTMLIGDIVDQGKNIMISGVPNVAYSWNGLRYRWPNKSTTHELKEDLNSTLEEMGMYRPTELFWYKAECTPDTNMVVRNIGGLPGLCAARCSQEKFEFIKDLAKAVNHEVLDVLKNISRLPFNILSTDFVQDDIVQRIIDLNKASDRGSTFVAESVEDLESEDVFVDSPSFSVDGTFEIPNPHAHVVKVWESTL